MIITSALISDYWALISDSGLEMNKEWDIDLFSLLKVLEILNNEALLINKPYYKARFIELTQDNIKVFLVLNLNAVNIKVFPVEIDGIKDSLKAIKELED